MKRRKSDIPQGAEERPVSEFRQEDQFTYLQISEYIFEGQIVGRRAYNGNGELVIETPLRNGKKHGREYTWNESGALESVELYFEGKIHGLAKQYGRNGKIIGTYRCVHGTGFDIWRSERDDGSVVISEIHSLQDGLPHGYEWWLNEDQGSVWRESHWQEGVLHGIERMWNNRGTLHRGYPKYWIHGQRVRKRAYLNATEQDKTLPAFQVDDDRPQRWFPAELESLLSK